jgi:predicted dehydrogenase
MALRVGIISANWGTFAHLPAWRSVPGVEVVGICTSRRETAEAAATKYQIERAFWDAEAMAADPRIDIIDCGTRPSVRHAMVLAALRNGKHVYNGIPFAADFEGARALYQAWKASGSVAIVDAYAEWLPTHRLAKSLINEGKLGQPFAGTCLFNMALFNQPDHQFPYNWFWQSGQGVSAIRNLGSHTLHTLLDLFGEVEEVVAYDGQLLQIWEFADGQRIKPETNDFANVLLRFLNGLMLQFQVSWSAPLGRGWFLEAFGRNGRFVMEAPSFPTSRDTTLHAGILGDTGLRKIEIPEHLQHSESVGIDADDQPSPAYPMALSMLGMVNAIEGDARAHPDFEKAWLVERVLEAIRRSSEEHRWVKLEEVQ